ncbi:MAG: four helix bundle protein [Saprospiraceae bacterium]
MTNKDFNEMFRKRTKVFAMNVIKFLEPIPYNSATRVISFQLCKAATSVGANFRAFCRGRSRNERFSKICIVVEEADETQYWLELFFETDYGNKDDIDILISEATEIVKITTTIKDNMTD